MHLSALLALLSLTILAPNAGVSAMPANADNVDLSTPTDLDHDLDLDLNLDLDLVTPAIHHIHDDDDNDDDNNVDDDNNNDLVKRKGGGGRGGGGGGRGGKGGGGGGSISSKPGGNLYNGGGRTIAGTGPQPSFGAGKYYGGGGTVPYTAGSKSPSGLAPVLLGLGALYVFGQVARAMTLSTFLYDWPQPYVFVNASANNATEELRVACACEEFRPCACDFPNDAAYMNEIVGNGSYANLNTSLVGLADYEGKKTIMIDGSLPNGTTAAGGDSDDPSSAVGLLGRNWLVGVWPAALFACAMVWMAT